MFSCIYCLSSLEFKGPTTHPSFVTEMSLWNTSELSSLESILIESTTLQDYLVLYNKIDLTSNIYIIVATNQTNIKFDTYRSVPGACLTDHLTH